MFVWVVSADRFWAAFISALKSILAKLWSALNQSKRTIYTLCRRTELCWEEKNPFEFIIKKGEIKDRGGDEHRQGSECQALPFYFSLNVEYSFIREMKQALVFKISVNHPLTNLALKYPIISQPYLHNLLRLILLLISTTIQYRKHDIWLCTSMSCWICFTKAALLCPYWLNTEQFHLYS